MTKLQHYYEMTEVTVAEVTTISRVLATSISEAQQKFDAGEGLVITQVAGHVVSVKSSDVEKVQL